MKGKELPMSEVRILKIRSCPSILKVSEVTPGSYVCIDPIVFKKGIQTLIDSPPSIEEKTEKVKKTAKKPD
jgi:hypothetical protein